MAIWFSPVVVPGRAEDQAGPRSKSRANTFRRRRSWLPLHRDRRVASAAIRPGLPLVSHDGVFKGARGLILITAAGL